MWPKVTEGKESPQTSTNAVQAATNFAIDSQPSAPAPATPSISSSAGQVPVTSGISAGLRFRGEFTGHSDLYIDGDVQGSIKLTNSKVTVGPHGNVQADIDARDIIVEGKVQGNLKAAESVRLGSKSNVQGSLLTPRIAIDDGARLRGKVEMVRPGEAKKGAAAGQTNSVGSPAPATAAKE
jgi:cytoskeletal protein CcmA (bactofilin family)